MNKRIVILGGGESGTGAAILAKAKGFDVFLSDLSTIQPKYKALLNARHIAWEEGRHTEADILTSDEVVKSPGIPDKAPIIKKLKEQGVPIISEIEFAGRYTAAKTICITGSNGKTTTTMLTFHILKQAGMDVGLAGNVGHSLALQVAEEPHAIYVIELSSFQLDNMYDFKADIAILLNITPDHMDSYNYQMQNYANAKFRVIRNQTPADAFIFWNDDPLIRQGITNHQPKATFYPFSSEKQPDSSEKQPDVKAYTANHELIVHTPNGLFTFRQDLLSLRGTHNLYNALAATLAAKLVNVPDDVIKASLSDFNGVPHRLEKIACIHGVEYINDSKATNVNSCRYALESMPAKAVLILGGTDKGNDYTEIDTLVKEKARALLFLGVDNSKLHHFFDGKVERIEDARSMKEAIDKATRLAEKGDTVLLSPCCASFDLFKNYEDRGEQFRQCVHQLLPQKE